MPRSEAPQPPSQSPFRALEQPRAFEEIILQISDAVIEGRLRPGDRLESERDLAETFGVSRASVREALRALEVFGVLTARRGSGRDAGSIVSAGGAEGLTNALRMHVGLLQIGMYDIVEVRAVLEVYAARKAAESKGPRTELRELVEQMATAESLDEYHQLDTGFHVALAQASGNVLLPILMESIRGAVSRDMLEGLKRLPDWRTAADALLAEHREIVALVEAGQGEAAAAALQTHIVSFYRQRADGESRAAA